MANIEGMVRMTGLIKQDYIIRRLLDQDVVVQGNIRIYKGLRDQMADILEELQRIGSSESADPELLRVISMMTRIMARMKEDNGTNYKEGNVDSNEIYDTNKMTAPASTVGAVGEQSSILKDKTIITDQHDGSNDYLDSGPDLDRFHMLSRTGEPIGVFDIEIVEDIIRNVPFIVIGSTPFVYEHGVYVEDASRVRLRGEIQRRLYRRFIRSQTLKRICDLLLAQPGIHKTFSDLYNYPPEWVNFRNGYYDPIGRQMIPHDPRYLAINQIPYEFHPERRSEILSDGEVITRYLDEAVPDSVEQFMIWEYLGYCMTTDTRMQKFLMVVGEGGTGKSVVIHLFQRVIGMENCSCISLQDLNRRFYATGLLGKLLNACGDIPCKALDSIDVLKKAVGEDSLIYEKKNQDALQFTSHAKLLFSSNGMPDNVEEKSDAFYRRLLILEMNHKPAVKDPRLKKRMDKETDYAIMMAMDALYIMYEQGALAESENSRRCVQEARKSADSVMAFICDRLEPSDGSWINRSSTYDDYVDYCRDNGRRPLGKARFISEMKRKGYTAVKNQGIYKYRDLKFKETPFEPIPDYVEPPFR